ncbi:Uncharacterised protein [BD1-7 clade bacterium]|uniref:Uncharacterized protein n=1 Tax=BD1-7 clade bacterium TaxID=2029982 RepID=A0A5S9Q4C5_9GAMM|nr:Uncharacterised protein [BD1-7 clade bacterium]CAA0111810.1 Uncharacterised protein [BD1-7 clade bacterium]
MHIPYLEHDGKKHWGIDTSDIDDLSRRGIDGSTVSALEADHCLAELRIERDRRMGAQDWRYQRYARELRLGVEPTESIETIDTLMQALANITETYHSLDDVVWPE